MIKKKSNLFAFMTFLFLFFLVTSCTVYDQDNLIQDKQSTTTPEADSQELSTIGPPIPISTVESKKISIWIDADISKHSYLDNLEFPTIQKNQGSSSKNFIFLLCHLSIRQKMCILKILRKSGQIKFKITI